MGKNHALPPSKSATEYYILYTKTIILYTILILTEILGYYREKAVVSLMFSCVRGQQYGLCECPSEAQCKSVGTENIHGVVCTISVQNGSVSGDRPLPPGGSPGACAAPAGSTTPPGPGARCGDACGCAARRQLCSPGVLRTPWLPCADGQGRERRCGAVAPALPAPGGGGGPRGAPPTISHPSPPALPRTGAAGRCGSPRLPPVPSGGGDLCLAGFPESGGHPPREEVRAGGRAGTAARLVRARSGRLRGAPWPPGGSRRGQRGAVPVAREAGGSEGRGCPSAPEPPGTCLGSCGARCSRTPTFPAEGAAPPMRRRPCGCQPSRPRRTESASSWGVRTGLAPRGTPARWGEARPGRPRGGSALRKDLRARWAASGRSGSAACWGERGQGVRAAVPVRLGRAGSAPGRMGFRDGRSCEAPMRAAPGWVRVQSPGLRSSYSLLAVRALSGLLCQIPAPRVSTRFWLCK